MTTNEVEQEDLYVARRGNCPFLLVASHSGTLVPAEIPSKRHLMSSNETVLSDLFTDTLIDEVTTHMHPAGLIPFRVYGCVSRTTINFNAPPEKAFVGIGQQGFNDFHSTVASYISAIRSLYDFALLLDIHGFKSEAAHARVHDIILGTRNGATLPLHRAAGLSRWRFCCKLQAAGWSVYPEDLDREDIFWGGYIVHHHADVTHFQHNKTGMTLKSTLPTQNRDVEHIQQGWI